MIKFKHIVSLVLSFVWMPICFALQPGNSAWVYSFKPSWVDHIKQVNASSQASNHFHYLFVNVGNVSVNSDHLLNIHYNHHRTQQLKKKLPNIHILANLSFWVKGTKFFKWSPAEYKKAADKIAHLVNQDPYVSGAFLDLEIYKPCLLPFYKELKDKLNQKDKILAFIVRPGEETKHWFEQTGSNSIAVLYGYDLHHPDDPSKPVSPKTYGKRLQKAVNHFVKTADQAKQHFMIGIPAIATTYEWHCEEVMSGAVLKNPYPQIDYFKQARAVTQSIQSKYYLGNSVWALVAKTKHHIRSPLVISTQEWKLLSSSN